MKHDTLFCAHCGKRTHAISEQPNHVLHLLLTLATCGLWLLVWGGTTAANIGNYRCNDCGSSV